MVREVIEPELVQAEPEQWKRIGQEVSRQLDYQPGKFFWQETVRPKYVRVGQRAVAAGDRARAGARGRTQSGRARLAGAIAGGQVLRPFALLPAGTNFPATARRLHQPATDGAMDGAKRAAALGHQRLSQKATAAEPLRASG